MLKKKRQALTKIIGKYGGEKSFSKWEYFCQNGRIIRLFWQKYSHFEKIGENILSFSPNFPMIFVSEGTSLAYEKKLKTLTNPKPLYMLTRQNTAHKTSHVENITIGPVMHSVILSINTPKVISEAALGKIMGKFRETYKKNPKMFSRFLPVWPPWTYHNIDIYGSMYVGGAMMIYII